MPSSRTSSDRSGSVGSQDFKKPGLTSKADPNLALNEAQPMANFGTGSTFSLRSIQHTDLSGNVIADPDRSNPTRSRMERPLDTIRSFEKAIERHRRENMMR